MKNRTIIIAIAVILSFLSGLIIIGLLLLFIIGALYVLVYIIDYFSILKYGKDYDYTWDYIKFNNFGKSKKQIEERLKDKWTIIIDEKGDPKITVTPKEGSKWIVEIPVCVKGSKVIGQVKIDTACQRLFYRIDILKKKELIKEEIELKKTNQEIMKELKDQTMKELKK